MARLEYFFDYVSPFAYLADTQLPALLERTGAEIVYRPFFLGGVMVAPSLRGPDTACTTAVARARIRRARRRAFSVHDRER